MTLEQNKMNDTLMAEWLRRHSNLSKEQQSILKRVKIDIGNDLDKFYEMNRIIVRGNGHVAFSDIKVEFACSNNVSVISTMYGNIQMNANDFRMILAAFIDIYEPIYPLGTIVDLKKKYFKNVLDVENMENLRVVIAHRIVPFINANYIPYIGLHYPYGAVDVENDGVHFTSKVIDKVVHMGYADEEEIAYLFALKNKVIVEKNMHSQAFMSREEYISIINKNKVTQR